MHYNDSNSAVARASRIRHAHDMEATQLDSMHRRATVPERPNVFSRAITRLRRERTGSRPNPSGRFRFRFAARPRPDDL